jgi:hypothetical protein
MRATPSGGEAPLGTERLGRPNALAGTVSRRVACRQASLTSGVASRECAGPPAAGSTSQASLPSASRNLARLSVISAQAARRSPAETVAP